VSATGAMGSNGVVQPPPLLDQVKSAIRAAWKLDADEGEQKLKPLTRWLERDHPSAVTSLREGLSDMFTINRLGLLSRLRKCLSTTNLIDSTHSGLRQKTRGVSPTGRTDL
jgi:putative transposase